MGRPHGSAKAGGRICRAAAFCNAGIWRHGIFRSAPALTGRLFMQDVLMLLFTAFFFAVAFLYVKACQKLR